VPGLVLAVERSDLSLTLLDANGRRTTFLEEAVAALDASDRVEVIRGRAEESGRDPRMRGAFDHVVSRSFGPPGVVAECAAPFLRVGGRLVVSEPQDLGDTPRWDPRGLSLVGMSPGAAVRQEPATLQVIEQTAPCPDRYPRRIGIPAKRPLF
jgi:16S rRNA (guanine527-N7)-methyltransferase